MNITITLTDTKKNIILYVSDASFSESLYGLRRRAVNVQVKKEDARSVSGDGIQHRGLEKHQKVLSVAFLVRSYSCSFEKDSNDSTIIPFLLVVLTFSSPCLSQKILCFVH